MPHDCSQAFDGISYSAECPANSPATCCGTCWRGDHVGPVTACVCPRCDHNENSEQKAERVAQDRKDRETYLQQHPG